MNRHDTRDSPGSVPARKWRWLTREPLLATMLSLCILLLVCDPQPWRVCMNWLDLPTVSALLGLLATAQGVRASGLIQGYARLLLRQVQTQRSLAYLLITLAALLSMLLTNDVSLFLMVPLTLALSEWVNMNVMRLVIFEALAVNAGSSLSPIGNPQNLLLWHHTGFSMLSFARGMFLPALIMGLVLALAVRVAFPDQSLRAMDVPAIQVNADPLLIRLSPLLLLAFVVLLEMGYVFPATALVLGVLGVLRPRVLRDLDWVLVATVALLFLTVGHVADLPVVAGFADNLDWSNPGKVYMAGILLSQLISNVPATVALLHKAPDPMLLAVAVNVGGSGLAFGSLASLIALRLEGSRRIWREFHMFSIPYLLVTAGLVWLVISR